MKIQDITEGYGRYYCSTDKKWKTRKGPKQTRKVNEFAPDGFNVGGEEFSPEMAKMAYDEGVVKGASLADGATTQRAMAINDWDKHDGGIYSQHFAKGFIAGRKDKIRHNNKQYNLNLQLMKDGSIRHGEQGVADGLNEDWTQLVAYGIMGLIFGPDIIHWFKRSTDKRVFKVFINGKDVSSKILNKEEAVAVINNLAKQEHDTKTQYAVVDTRTNNIVLRRTWSDTENDYHNRGWVDSNESVKQGVAEEKTRLDPKCWDGYKKQGTKMKGGVRVNNCVKEELEETYDGDEFFEAYGELWYNEDEQLDEAEYQGRSVPLGKPMQGDVKKFKVYVKDPSTGNVKKVNFGDPDMKIRKSNPAARRSFRARHNCDNPGPRTSARYWSCRKW